VVCDVVEIAHSTPGVHTFTIDVSMRAMLQLCAAVATHWPNLRDLCLVLIETPPPRLRGEAPALPGNNNNHFHDDESDEEVSFEVMDGRDIDFRTTIAWTLSRPGAPTTSRSISAPSNRCPFPMFSYQGTCTVRITLLTISRPTSNASSFPRPCLCASRGSRSLC
jgi:hypothetical protein